MMILPLQNIMMRLCYREKNIVFLKSSATIHPNSQIYKMINKIYGI